MSGERMQQEKPGQKIWFPVLAGVLILAIIGVLAYPYMQKQQIPVLKAMSDFTLENIDGTTYTFSESTGKVRLVEFIFTNCPDICPATTYNMTLLQDKLKEENLFGDKVEFLTITFDPEYDTAEVLQEYAETFRADQSGWKFLRGDEAAIEAVTQDFGMAVMKLPDDNSPSGYSITHTARMFLVDKDGNMRQAYGMAADMDMDLMLKEMKILAD